MPGSIKRVGSLWLVFLVFLSKKESSSPSCPLENCLLLLKWIKDADVMGHYWTSPSQYAVCASKLEVYLFWFSVMFHEHPAEFYTSRTFKLLTMKCWNCSSSATCPRWERKCASNPVVIVFFVCCFYFEPNISVENKTHNTKWVNRVKYNFPNCWCIERIERSGLFRAAVQNNIFTIS